MEQRCTTNFQYVWIRYILDGTAGISGGWWCKIILDVPKKRKTNREGQWPMNVKYGSNPDMKFTNPNALSLSNSEMFRDQGSKAKGYEWIISQRRVLNPGNNCNRLGHWPHGLSLLPGTMPEQSCEKDDPGSQPSISKKTFVISCYISSMDIINQKSLKKVLAPMKHQWNSHHCVQFPMPEILFRHTPSPSRHPEFIDSSFILDKPHLPEKTPVTITYNNRHLKMKGSPSFCYEFHRLRCSWLQIHLDTRS